MTKDSKNKMWLLLIVVREDLVQDILAAFIEVDISGATIVNSQGMGRTLAYEFPIFAGFMNEMRNAKPYNKTIFTALDDLSKVEKFRRILREIDLDFTEPDTGVMFVVPISYAAGTNFEFSESDND